MNLEAANYLYRHPDRYEQLQANTQHTAATLCTELIDIHGPDHPRTLLDLGCGTGLDLAELATRFECTGIDIQPGMVEFARRCRPWLDVRVGDIRTFRLGHTVDAIISVGLVLSYLHDKADLDAALRTCAAHAHPSTLLVLHTLVAPVEQPEPTSHRVEVGELRATATVHYDWNNHRQIGTMHRHWAFDNGTEATDRIERRVHSPRELDQHLRLAGFEPLTIFEHPTAVASSVTGPVAYIAARYTGSHPAGPAPTSVAPEGR